MRFLLVMLAAWIATNGENWESNDENDYYWKA